MTDRERPIRIAPLPDPAQGSNPYLRLLYKAEKWGQLKLVPCPGVRIKWLFSQARYLQVLHLHWPSYLYAHPNAAKRWCRAGKLLLFLAVARLFRVRCVWTAHNLYPHVRAGRIDHVVRWAMLRLLDHVLVHDERMIGELRNAFGARVKCSVLPHMSYEEAYGPPVDRYSARERLQISTTAFVFLHFGAISRYKRFDELVNGFRKIRRNGDLLLVVGEPVDDATVETLRKGAQEGWAKLILRDVDPHEVPVYCAAADVGVSASNASTSGTLFLYATYGLPVVAKRDTAGGFENDVAFLYGTGGLEDALRSARDASAERLSAFRMASLKLAQQRNPDFIAQQLVEVLQYLVRSPYIEH